MATKLKLAVNWAGACGGCDVALLDSETRILDLAEAADLVYWPVAMDFKRERLESFGSGEIDIGVFNGVIRTAEQEEDAKILRDRCKYLVAFGACAAFGGIPGLANLTSREAMLDTVYRETASTDNPDDLRPQTESVVDGRRRFLPALHETVKALHHVVDVDLVVPGCPPPPLQVGQLIDAVVAVAEGGEPPPRGTVLASDKAMCDECPRVESRSAGPIQAIHRPHLIDADPERCFLDQGILCLGIATRGGCGTSCIAVNMPCRGCFGPTDAALDPAAEALSAIGALVGPGREDDLKQPQRLRPVRSIADVAGTFYRFTLPSATVFRSFDDTPGD